MKLKIIGICAALVCTFSFNGTVAAQENRDYVTAMEECFWGLLLTNEDQRTLSLGLNLVSGALGSYAYTSATASADSFCAEKTASTASFINESYPELLEDTARGEGQHLYTVLELAGCDANGKAAAIPLIRADMASAVSAPGYSAASSLDKAFTMFKSVNLRTDQACKIG